MKVTYKKIFDARDALVSLSNAKLPIKISYGINKLIRKANQRLTDLSGDREKIIKKHVPEGTEMTTEIQQTIIAELNTVLEQETDIDMDKIDLSAILNDQRGFSEVNISANDINLLDPFFIFEAQFSENEITENVLM
jgi:hypothetical protein